MWTLPIAVLLVSTLLAILVGLYLARVLDPSPHKLGNLEVNILLRDRYGPHVVESKPSVAQ